MHSNGVYQWYNSWTIDQNSVFSSHWWDSHNKECLDVPNLQGLGNAISGNPGGYFWQNLFWYVTCQPMVVLHLDSIMMVPFQNPLPPTKNFFKKALPSAAPRVFYPGYGPARVNAELLCIHKQWLDGDTIRSQWVNLLD